MKSCELSKYSRGASADHSTCRIVETPSDYGTNKTTTTTTTNTTTTTTTTTTTSFNPQRRFNGATALRVRMTAAPSTWRSFGRLVPADEGLFPAVGMNRSSTSGMRKKLHASLVLASHVSSASRRMATRTTSDRDDTGKGTHAHSSLCQFAALNLPPGTGT